MSKGSGFIGDLSQQQEEVFQKFKEYVQSKNLDPERYDDYFCARFLRARKYDLAKTTEMFDNHLKWRKDNDVDNALGFRFPEVRVIKEFYPHGYHKTDRQGRSIYIECLGRLDMNQLFEHTSEERMLKYFIREYERLILERFKAASKAAGKRIETSLTILDLDGVSMKLANKRVFNFIKVASGIAQDNYPEMLAKMYILNAPYLFSGAWSVIKKFLDERTRNKIEICRKGQYSDLFEQADPANIPAFLGGTCRCPQGCLQSGIGPWNPDGLPLDETGAVIWPEQEVQEEEEQPVIDLNDYIDEPEEDTSEESEESSSEIEYLDLYDEDLRQIEYISQLNIPEIVGENKRFGSQEFELDD